MLRTQLPITLHDFEIDDIIFFKNEEELVYYRSSKGTY